MKRKRKRGTEKGEKEKEGKWKEEERMRRRRRKSAPELDLPYLLFKRHREDSFKNIFSFQPREGLRGHDFYFQKESRSRLFKNIQPNILFAT